MIEAVTKGAEKADGTPFSFPVNKIFTSSST